MNMKTAEISNEEMEGLLADLGLSSDDIFEIDEPAITDDPIIAAEVTLEAAVPEVLEVVVAEVVPDAPKVAAVRKHYASKSERLSDKFGDKLGDYLVLEVTDAALDADALKTKQIETMEMIKTAGVKVQGRAVFILEFIAGKTAKLNGVIESAFKTLAQDGKLTTGNEGNLHHRLLAHPYSPLAAKSMGGNTILAMKTLKVITKSENGSYIPNPNSVVRSAMNSMLGIA